MKKGLTMSESKRKIFSSAEKAKVALAAVKGINTINEIAQEHGVHPTQVNQWKKELLDNASRYHLSKSIASGNYPVCG